MSTVLSPINSLSHNYIVNTPEKVIHTYVVIIGIRHDTDEQHNRIPSVGFYPLATYGQICSFTSIQGSHL